MNDIVTIPGRNGGTLTPGNPGNKGGLGKPKEEIRAICRLAFEERIPLLVAIIDNPDSTPEQKIKAIEKLIDVSGLKQEDRTSGDKAIETVTIKIDGEASVSKVNEMIAGLEATNSDI